MLVSSDLKVRKQCVSVRNRANRFLGFNNRTVTNKSEEVILKLYLALVRPHLDYAVQFWSRSYRRDTNLLESVQRRLTRMIQGLRNLTYQDRLEYLKSHSLERRRVQGDLMKYSNGSWVIAKVM